MKCRAHDCDEKARRNSPYCRKHGMGRRCCVPNCWRKATRPQSLCYKHYQTHRSDYRDDKLTRFNRYVIVNKVTGCWDWQGGKSNGYGMFYDGNQAVHAHVFSYILKHGTPQRRVYIKCGNRACCNPEHLTTESPHHDKPRRV